METLQKAIELIKETNFEKLFVNAFGQEETKVMFQGNEENNYCSDTTEYALMMNVETDELFILHYATKDNNWADIAEQHNPWICVGYISPFDVINDNWGIYLIEKLENQIYQFQQQENLYSNYLN